MWFLCDTFSPYLTLSKFCWHLHPQPQDHFSMKKFTVFLIGTIISYGKLSLVFWSLKKNDRALFEKMAFLDFAS